MKHSLYILCIALVAMVSCGEGTNSNENGNKSQSKHPNLILTKQGVKDIKANLGSIPIFDETLAATKKELDAEIAAGFDVPTPKDYSGGYTHARHKKNYSLMQKAGVLYQI